MLSQKLVTSLTNVSSVERAKQLLPQLSLPDSWGRAIDRIAQRWPFLTAEQLIQSAAALIPSTLVIACHHLHCRARVQQILPDLDLHRGDYHWVEYRGGPANTLGFNYLAGEIRELERRRVRPYEVIRAFSVSGCGLSSSSETSMSVAANGARQLLLGMFEQLAQFEFPTHRIFVYDLARVTNGEARLIKST